MAEPDSIESTQEDRPAPVESVRSRASGTGTDSATGPLTTDAQPIHAYELLAQSPRLGDLVAIATRIVTDGARARSVDWAFTSQVTAAAAEAKVSRGDADTRFGNVLDVLATGGGGGGDL